MADLRLALLIEARSDQARAQLAQTKAALDLVKGATGVAGAAATGGANALDRLAAAGGTVATELTLLSRVQPELAAKTDVTTAETLAFGQAMDAVRARFNPIFAASRQYEQQLLDIAAAEEIGAINALEAAAARDRAAAAMTPFAGSVRVLGTNAGAANANLTNLTFQLQDVAMMASLGQAPLALMMQQGPQIAGVFDQMRQSGQRIGPAILGSLRSLVSPMSLLTLGAVGAAAAIVQVGVSSLGAGQEAETFEDRLDDLSSVLGRIDNFDFSLSLDAMAVDATEIRDRFAEIRRLAEETQGIQLQEALRSAIDGIGLVDALGSYSTQRSLQSQIGADPPQFDALGFSDPERALQAAQLLNQISGNTREELAESVNLTILWLRGSGLLTDELNAQLLSLIERMGLEQVIREDLSVQTAELQAQGQEALQISELRATDAAAAQSLLADLQQQTALQEAIATYGRDSALVAQLVADQERAAFVERANSLDITAQLRAELIGAYDASVEITQVNLVGVMNAAAGAAAGIFGNVSSAAGAAWDLAAGLAAAAAANLNPYRAANLALGDDERGASTPDSVRLEVADLRAQQALVLAQQRAAAYQRGQPGPAGSGGASGGGGGALAVEADAAADLITRLREEQALLRETDPVQQELLRQREALAGATADQRAEIEGLIRSNIAEKTAVEAAADAMGFYRETTYDFLTGMVARGRDAEEVWRNLGATVADAAAKALLLGEGSLAGILGGGEGGAIGGLFELIGEGRQSGSGGLLSWLFAADGGWVTGPGGPRDDLVPAMLSNGEFVVNAKAAARHGALLAAINSGVRLADGGPVGQVPGGSGFGGGDTINMTFDLRGAVGGPELERHVERAIQKAIEANNAAERRRIQRALADPRRIS